MSKKTKRLAKGLGASALAIATIASGLSFGATAASASINSESNRTQRGLLVTASTLQDYSAPFANGIGSVSMRGFSSATEAKAHATEWSIPREGMESTVRPTSNPELCLNSVAQLASCVPGDPLQQWRLSKTSSGYGVSGTGLESVGRPGHYFSFSYKNDRIMGTQTGSAADRIETIADFTSFGAEVTTVDIVGRSAVVTGRGTPGADVVLQWGDGEYEDETRVNDEGVWDFELDNLKLGSNPVKLLQYENQELTSEYDLDVELKIADLVVEHKFGENASDLVTLSGTAQGGAIVEVFNEDDQRVVGSEPADSITGAWSVELPAPNKGGSYDVNVYQALQGERASKTPVSIDYGKQLVVTRPADGFVHPGGQIDVRGTGEPGATVEVHEGDRRVGGPVKVRASQSWDLDTTDLDAREHRLTVTQKSKGGNVQTDTIIVNEGESSVPAPTAKVEFGAAVTDRARVTGTAQDGATVTVRDAKNAVVGSPQVVDGRYSLPVNSPGAGERSFFVTQRIDNEVSEPTRAVGDFGAAVAVTALPAQSTPGDVTVAGTGETGAKVSVKVGTQTQTVDVVDDRWSTTVELAPSNTAANITVSQTAQGNTVTTGAASTTPNLPIPARAVTIDEPSSHEYTPLVETTLTGTATPYASVKIETKYGKEIRVLKADKNGNWSFNREYGPSSVYTFIATQTRVDGTTSQSGAFVMSPIGAFRPLTVTSHEDGGTYTSGENTFRGTATPDAMVRITNQWGRVIASTQASPVSGAWEAKGKLGPTAPYTLTFTQTAPDEQKDMVTMDLSSDMQAYEDAALTSPSNNSTYKPGVTTFTGTGSEGTNIVAKNQWGTLMGQATVDANGRWAFDRNVGPSADYQITFTATRGTDGNTFTVNLNSPKFAALTLTSHAVGDTYEPLQRVTFSGKASPFATITTYSRGETPLANATAVADANGDWSYTRSWGSPNGDSTTYPLRFVQTDVYGAEQDTLPFTWAPNPTE
ncbi:MULTISPECIES: hypothetical protein [Curtobacterium]|uniref:hypothetical protein n=1 Tax=Curtobacterium flaccumfaciens TaxID=2035 RepID=UPI003EE6ABD1